jgi:excisionase family DNA binding protein
MIDSPTRIALTIGQAVTASSVSRTTLYRALQAGELEAKKRGKRTLIMADELRRWLENLPSLRSTPADLPN